jgi:hypothetical protein
MVDVGRKNDEKSERRAAMMGQPSNSSQHLFKGRG